VSRPIGCHVFQDFVDKASKAGPATVVAVYFSGSGLQLAGENYASPVDAAIAREADEFASFHFSPNRGVAAK